MSSAYSGSSSALMLIVYVYYYHHMHFSMPSRPSINIDNIETNDMTCGFRINCDHKSGSGFLTWSLHKAMLRGMPCCGRLGHRNWCTFQPKTTPE